MERKIDNLISYLRKKESKEKLFNLVKKQGEYIRLSETQGYIYYIPVGSVEGDSVGFEVGIKSGNIEILTEMTDFSQLIAN